MSSLRWITGAVERLCGPVERGGYIAMQHGSGVSLSTRTCAACSQDKHKIMHLSLLLVSANHTKLVFRGCRELPTLTANFSRACTWAWLGLQLWPRFTYNILRNIIQVGMKKKIAQDLYMRIISSPHACIMKSACGGQNWGAFISAKWKVLVPPRAVKLVTREY